MRKPKYISSSDNPNYKGWLKLLQRKFRDLESKFIIEGEVLLEDAAKSGGEICELLFSSDIEKLCDAEEYSVEEYISDLVRKLNQNGKTIDKYYILSSELFQKLSQTENGRRVIGIVKKPVFDSFLDDVKVNKEKATEGNRSDEGRTLNKNILVLDRLQDPGNMGTIIRTADAAGFNEIIAIKGTVDAFSPKVVRSAAGSIIRIPITYVDGTDELVDRIRLVWNNEEACEAEKPKKESHESVELSGGTIIATAMNGESNLWETDLSGSVAIIIGNEGAGVSPELIELADKRISIPMQGNIESLNAGVSASLLMYEVFRQQRQ